MTSMEPCALPFQVASPVTRSSPVLQPSLVKRDLCWRALSLRRVLRFGQNSASMKETASILSDDFNIDGQYCCRHLYVCSDSPGTECRQKSNSKP